MSVFGYVHLPSNKSYAPSRHVGAAKLPEQITPTKLSTRNETREVNFHLNKYGSLLYLANLGENGYYLQGQYWRFTPRCGAFVTPGVIGARGVPNIASLRLPSPSPAEKTTHNLSETEIGNIEHLFTILY